MKPERWQQIERLCYSALEIEPDRREAFLEQACAGDDSLRRQVDELLAHDISARGLMNAPAMQLAARQLAQERTGSIRRGDPVRLEQNT